MDIEIISGPAGSGKTTRLNQFEQGYHAAGQQVLHIQPEFTLAGIRRRLILASLQGYAAAMIDECPPDKVKKLCKAKEQIEERIDSDLKLYIVERA